MKIPERIKGCIKVEEAAVFIYRDFMKMFPDEKKFWEGLYKDEKNHAFFLTGADYLKVLTRLPPSMPLVKKTLTFANNIIGQIKLNPVLLKDALEMALKLEESMVETYANELIADLKAYEDESFFLDFEKIFMDEKAYISKIRDMMIKKNLLKLS